MSFAARYADPAASAGVLNEVLALQLARRSVRSFADRPVTDDELTARNHPAEVAAELGLPPHAVATFGLAVGAPDPAERAGIKPRLPQGAVLHRETYDAAAADAHIDAYDERLAGYNARFGLPGNWSGRVLARLKGPESMAGRHTLRQTLVRLGLPSR